MEMVTGTYQVSENIGVVSNLCVDKMWGESFFVISLSKFN